MCSKFKLRTSPYPPPTLPLPPLPPPLMSPPSPPSPLAPDDEPLDLILRDGHPTPSLIDAALDIHLLPLLPLLLSSSDAHLLFPSLQRRLCASRPLKLRFLLLRSHTKFRHLACKRRFASWAYADDHSSTVAKRALAARKRAPDPDALDDHPAPALQLLVDLVDLQSEEFFHNELFNYETRQEASFGHTMLSHPFLPPEDLDESDANTASDSGRSSSAVPSDMAQRTHLVTEHGQTVVELRRICPVANMLEREHTEPVPPAIVVRQGDALRHVAVDTLLRVFNSAWARPSRQFPDAASAPYCAVVDVAIVGQDRLLEVARGKTTNIEAFKFDYWRYTRGQDPVLADSFVRSAAGAFTAAYVLGLAKNVADVGVCEGREVFFRELKGAFEYVPQVARLVVPKRMRDAFQELGVLDAFRDTCIRAFMVIRDSHKEIFEVVFDLLQMAGFGRAKVLQYVAAKNNLNLAEDRMMANTYFRKWIG